MQSTNKQAENPDDRLNTYADRVRIAMKSGLNALVEREVAKIDETFGRVERILLAVYDNWNISDIPGDLRLIVRDLRVYRDSQVDAMTHRATEDFREAMALVEKAIVTTHQQAPPEPTRHEYVDKCVQAPAGLTEEEKKAVLQLILAKKSVSAAQVRSTLRLDSKQVQLKRFLAWTRKSGLTTTSGQRAGTKYSPSKALMERMKAC